MSTAFERGEGECKERNDTIDYGPSARLTGTRTQDDVRGMFLPLVEEFPVDCDSVPEHSSNVADHLPTARSLAEVAASRHRLRRTAPRVRLALADAMTAISDGDTEALRICIELAEARRVIDPDATFGDLTPFMALAAIGVSAKRLTHLWNGVCERDTTNLIALLRANTLGIAGASNKAINQAIDHDDRGELQLDLIVAAVKKRLSNFGRRATTGPSE